MESLVVIITLIAFGMWQLEVVYFLFNQGGDTTIKKGYGKTILDLAEESKYAEIIEKLKSYNLGEGYPSLETDRLKSHISQPVAVNRNQVSVFHNDTHANATGGQTASTVLPPFSGELRVDKKVKLSHDDFKKSVKEFYANKKLSVIDQLKATPPYPTPHMLAQFASMAYHDCKHGDPEPPDGWQLLTTASNFRNGYFGTAYWHPEYQQVVIAHRGTDIKNIGALLTNFKYVFALLNDIYTDIVGVLFNNYVNQMSSASTFANKVVTVLQETEREKKVSFELFFTGHSLGGWLAQITAFTTKYLEENRGKFLKKLTREQEEPPASNTLQDSHDITHSYHPHTVVFDSPGCEVMLLEMKKKIDVRLHGSSIDLKHLDITSYLSAPNLINTCNSHVGTVYRIFIDLSDMDWKENKTLLYNLATHSMDKIVQAFDPETGQVHKHDDDRLKILEVVDWPVSAGLRYGPELDDFFKWANYLNNYQPDVKEIPFSKVPKGYHPLRYQTKAFDECTKDLSAFTQDEQEFLDRYHWLRQVPEFFKPGDLFSEMNNFEAEKEAEKKLQNFELDNGSVRCPDASTLHSLIPYVTRLVRLFPHVKQGVKDKLSSFHIRNRIYQYETQLSVAKIINSALDFNPDALGLSDFLTSDRKIWQLRMIAGDVWAGITKVYGVLQNTSCTSSCFSEYTILELERLITLNRLVNFNALLASTETSHLLMIACGTNQTVNDELSNMLKDLFSILKEKKTMKIILTTQLDDSTTDFIQQIATETFGEGFVTTDEELTWSDLTASSQRKMLEKTVIFQGRRVALNQLTSAESITDSFPLADLLQEKELRIGEEPVPSAGSGYNERYYIDRTFNHNIFVRQDIEIDKLEEKFADLLASNQQEFKQLCQKNPKSNVHWLLKDMSGELIWQQSQGNLQTLRKYIDGRKTHSYASSDLDKLLQQANHQRVMIIADKAGMGKTTVLTHLSHRIKHKFPAHWCVRINLNDYTELLEAQKGKTMDKWRVLEFVSKEVLKLESHLEKELFKKTFEGNGVTKLVVMVDGFDEISPSYKKTVIDMLQVLKQTSLEQLWVTTRPHLRKDLEDNLQQLSYTLQPFSEVEQLEFLKKLWLQHLDPEATDHDRLRIYATALIRNLAHSISDKDIQFTGIPLQIRMLAEAFEEEFISFYMSEKSEPELPRKLELLELYKRFIDRKYEIYYEEKCKTPVGNVALEVLRQNIFEQLQRKHQLVALEELITEDQVTLLQNDKHPSFSDEDLFRVGIAQRNNESKPQFIHRTFAEYFVAQFLIKELRNKSEENTQVQDILFKTILLRTEFEVTRSFLNALLKGFQPSKETLKDYGKKLDEMWNEKEIHRHLTGVITALHTAAGEDNVLIIRFLLDSLRSGEYSNTTKKILLAKDYKGQNALQMAASTSSVQALKELWEWVEIANLNTREIKNEFLLAQDNLGRMAVHKAAFGGSLEAIETIWIWAKKAEINRDEFLLAQDEEGFTALHVASFKNHVGILEKLWFWAEEGQVNANELKKNLFLAKDNRGYTAWHRAVEVGSLEALETLFSFAKDVKLKPNELLLARTKKGSTLLHTAAYGNRVGILEKLWVWAEEAEVNANELKQKLLLAKDNRGYTAWHRAAQEGSLEAIETLCSFAKEVKLKPDELLLVGTEKGSTLLHIAAYGNRVGILQKLWVWAKEAEVNANELKKKLLLAEDNRGYTAWHQAVQDRSLEAIETLCSFAKEVKLKPDELLLVGTEKSSTALHIAAYGNHVGILEKLWVWAVEAEVKANELKKKLFLAEGSNGRKAWHGTAVYGSLEALERLWSLANEAELKPDELLYAACARLTAMYIAANPRHVGILDKLFVWASEARVNSNELYRKVLLDKHEYGFTVWHRAALEGSLETLEILWSMAKEAELKPDELFLAQSEDGITAFHMAARGNHVGILENFCIWAEEAQVKGNEIKKELLLAKDQYGLTAWHHAATNGSLEALETLWIWTKEVEINRDELLLAQDEGGYTALHLAACTNRVGILEKLWFWSEESKANGNDLKKNLLLAKDNDGYTAWHRAANLGNLEALEALWRLANEVELKPDEFLLAQVEGGMTALHIAAYLNHIGILKKLLLWAEEVEVNANEIKKKLLLAKDDEGYTAWHRAANFGSLEALETLWRLAKEVELKPNEFLLAEVEGGMTALHIAVYLNHVGILKKLLLWAEEAEVNANELKKKLLLAKDNEGYRAWDRAAQKGSLEAIEILRSWGKEAGINRDELWLVQNKEGKTALHKGAQ